MPAALYKLARDPSRPNPNPVLLAGGRASTTSRQVAARFLCEECEQRFSDLGERYVLAQCARPNEFRLRDLLANLVPIEQGRDEHGRDVHLYDVAGALGFHTDECLYFAASAFWRASARSWAENKQFSLGDVYTEKFRLYLRGEAAFPENGRLFVLVWSDPIRPDAAIGFTTIAPCSSRIDGERRHKFCIPGITFVLFLGGRVAHRHDGGALNSTQGKFMFLSPFSNDSLFRGAGELVRHSRPSDSLIRSTFVARGLTPPVWPSRVK